MTGRRWVVALDVQLEIIASSQQEAEHRARTALRTRPGETAAIERQRVRWALQAPPDQNTCGPVSDTGAEGFRRRA